MMIEFDSNSNQIHAFDVADEHIRGFETYKRLVDELVKIPLKRKQLRINAYNEKNPDKYNSEIYRLKLRNRELEDLIKPAKFIANEWKRATGSYFSGNNSEMEQTMRDYITLANNRVSQADEMLEEELNNASKREMEYRKEMHRKLYGDK
jgi:hypothetical protein